MHSFLNEIFLHTPAAWFQPSCGNSRPFFENLLNGNFIRFVLCHSVWLNGSMKPNAFEKLLRNTFVLYCFISFVIQCGPSTPSILVVDCGVTIVVRCWKATEQYFRVLLL